MSDDDPSLNLNLPEDRPQSADSLFNGFPRMKDPPTLK